LPQEFDVVCLGGGVAGEAIAVGLRDSGLTLAVVERELVGGECPYWGCVPSKTLLRSAETLSEAGRARVLATSRVEWTVDFPKISTRVLWMAGNLEDTRPAATMEATGARVFRGEGKLTDPRTVAVGDEQLTARRAVVIANGSIAGVPRIPASTLSSIGPIDRRRFQRSCRCRSRFSAAAPSASSWARPSHGSAPGVTVIEAGPCAGEIVGELVLAIKLRIPLKTLADVIHPFPAFNRVLGGSLHELAAKASNKAPHDPDVIHHNQWRSQ
jgi:pyruvate/2-oxoglutarate dehydrogenase complex dihydrolipoamide dehydrogenase (E3) component